MFKILVVGFFVCLGWLPARAAGNLLPNSVDGLSVDRMTATVGGTPTPLLTLFGQGAAQVTAARHNTGPANVQKVFRSPFRVFTGQALTVNDGGDFFNAVGRDWLEQTIQASSTAGQLVVVADPGTYAGAVMAARTSDFALAQGYSFGSMSFCLNDAVSPVNGAQKLCIGNYSEVRGYPSSGTTQALESDSVNQGGPTPTLDPYNWIGQLPATINAWLSSGRPDIQLVTIGGTITAGQVFTLTATVPTASVSYTAIGGDTPASVASGLATAINANTNLKAASLYGKAFGALLSIGGSFIGTTWTSTPPAGATLTFNRGSNTSVAVGILNNCNGDQTCGSYLTGILFTSKSLVGTDGTDSSTGYGTALSLGRNHSLEWHDATGGSPVKARIVSSTTSTGTIFPQMTFNDTGILFGSTSGTGWAQVGPGGLSVYSAISASGNIYSPGITLTATTVAALPTCNTGLANTLRAVTDATSPTYRGALTGGGTIHIPVFCDGPSWTAH